VHADVPEAAFAPRHAQLLLPVRPQPLVGATGPDADFEGRVQRPLDWFTSTAMIRSRAPDPLSFAASAAAESPGRRPAPAMATIMITRICDGRNEFDFFIIKDEWFQKLSFPGLHPKFF